MDRRPLLHSRQRELHQPLSHRLTQIRKRPRRNLGMLDVIFKDDLIPGGQMVKCSSSAAKTK